MGRGRSRGRTLMTAAGRIALLGAIAAGGFALSRPDDEERAEQLLSEQVALLADADAWRDSVDELRGFNPEWDFMRRTFLALALADDALAHPERAEERLATIDRLLDELVSEEAAAGQARFLLPYVHARPFRDPAGRSLFVDGEIALVAAARRLVSEDEVAARIHRERVVEMEAMFERSPAGLPESYPDEAWLFCVTNALVAIRAADVLDGTDHQALLDDFLVDARRALVEPETGMLGSSYTWDGRMLDGPEGSTVWLVATNLLVLDAELARDQYERARTELGHSLLGFGWASEWGSGWRGPVDVDSGPIVPILDASPSSSGFAILASHAFGDERTARRLSRSLGVADVVVHLDPRLEQLADNPMGDVIVLHGLTFGPLWARLASEPRTTASNG
ncbi:MAG: hypothetical protein H6738_07030 [Alphaproteobacteria bacterium]|nr:hypothetical protein [Alphaproteobacteria bacterium]MCB9696516.1 hypothetical protein [Alphaproteobacteria bacterium]